MNHAKLTTLLRWALIADAVSCVATGVLLLAGADMLGPYLGMPTPLLRGAGAILLPFAALVAFLATRNPIRRPAAWAVITVNALWAVDSVLLLLTDWVSPTGLGLAFVVVQALAVAALAEVQYVGLRRLPRLA